MIKWMRKFSLEIFFLLFTIIFDLKKFLLNFLHVYRERTRNKYETVLSYE